MKELIEKLEYLRSYNEISDLVERSLDGPMSNEELYVWKGDIDDVRVVRTGLQGWGEYNAIIQGYLWSGEKDCYALAILPHRTIERLQDNATQYAELSHEYGEYETEYGMVALRQEPCLDSGSHNFRAAGVDKYGNEYNLGWVVLPDWEPESQDYSDACDWDNPLTYIVP